MTKKMKPIVFDAHAILKWLQMEQGWEEVKKILVAYRQVHILLQCLTSTEESYSRLGAEDYLTER